MLVVCVAVCALVLATLGESTESTSWDDLSHWRNFNFTPCQDNLLIYVYQIDLRNRSSIIANPKDSHSFPFWSLGIKCYFGAFGSLNMLNHHIIDWSREAKNMYITSDPRKACLFVVPAIPNGCWISNRFIRKATWNGQKMFPGDVKRKIVAKWLRKLPYWNLASTDGGNHVILDFFDMDDSGPWSTWGRQYSKDTGRVNWSIPFPYASIDVGHSIVAGSSLDRRTYRHNFDLSIFLSHTYSIQSTNVSVHKSASTNKITNKTHNKSYSNISNSFELLTSENRNVTARLVWNDKNRPHLSCFFGKLYHHCCSVRKNIYDLAVHVNNNSVLFFDKNESAVGISYGDRLTKCKFGFVLRGKGYHSFRLLEVMAAGAIPILVNDFGVLPFEDIWDWSKFSVIYAEGDVWRFVTDLIRLSQDASWMASAHDQVVRIYDRHLSSKKSIWELIIGTIVERVKYQLRLRRQGVHL